MKENSLSIIIPTLNNFEGLSYLLDYFQNKPFQVIIVDNAPDRKKKKLVEKYKKNRSFRLVYLPQKENLGFSKSINLGAKYAFSDWLLILNDDIRFDIAYKEGKNPLEELIAFAKKNNLDAAAALLVNPGGRVENFGYKVLPYGKVYLLSKEDIKRILKDKAKEKKAPIIDQEEIDGLTAACLLIKRKAFFKVGGFDESFFAYLEDVEFFLRFKKAGSKFGLDLKTKVLHQHMKTTKTLGAFKEKQDLINWWRLYFKHRDKFKFNLKFLLERARNLWGYGKKVQSLKVKKFQ